MTLQFAAEVVWQFYQQGKPNVAERTFDLRDITQFLKLAFANSLRKAYYDSKRMDEYGEADYGLISGLLVIKRIKLSPAVEGGGNRRSIAIKDLEMYRFPKDSQLVNVFPVNSKCSGQRIKASTLVKPGEEYFYQADKFARFLFHTRRAEVIETYNWPACIEEADVEATCPGDDLNVHLDVVYDAAVLVLNMSLGIKNLYDPIVLRKQLEKEQKIK